MKIKFVSNHEGHLAIGGVIYVLIYGGYDILPKQILAFIVVLIVAIIVEYKDKLHNCKFDLIDILYTMIIPAFLTISKELSVIIGNCVSNK